MQEPEAEDPLPSVPEEEQAEAADEDGNESEEEFTFATDSLEPPAVEETSQAQVEQGEAFRLRGRDPLSHLPGSVG